MNPVPTCSQCAAPLPVEFLNAPELRPCTGCAAPVRAELFPAFFRETAVGGQGEALLVDSEASCFYHLQKRAAAVCAACGRFLCGLCDVEMEGAHYCPDCLHQSQQKGKLGSIDNSRRLMDLLAFHLALGGIVIFYFAIVTAPLAVYFGFKHWNTPLSIVRRSRWRLVAAIVLGSLQILGGLALVGFLLTR
jgi:hypothetical protein